MPSFHGFVLDFYIIIIITIMIIIIILLLCTHLPFWSPLWLLLYIAEGVKPGPDILHYCKFLHLNTFHVSFTRRAQSGINNIRSVEIFGFCLMIRHHFTDKPIVRYLLHSSYPTMNYYLGKQFVVDYKLPIEQFN